MLRPFGRLGVALLSATLATTMIASGARAVPEEPQEPPVAATSSPIAGTETFPGNDGQNHTVTYDEHSFMVDGKRLNVWSGEIHYWRLPSPEHWRDLFQKIRANGFNAVSLYFFWGYHSHERGQYDFAGVKDIDLLMRMAAEEGLYIIARPGPYVNAEISMGGLPAYMTNYADGLRSARNAEAVAASREWLHAFNGIAAKHQVTNGTGSIVMYQVENEMLSEDYDRAQFVKQLIDQVTDDNITVPVFHNDFNFGQFRFLPAAHGGKGTGSNIGLDFYAYDSYPMGFTCSNQRGTISDTESQFRSRVKDNPIFISEAQGGAFTPWGASFTPELCDRFIDGNFMRQWGVNNVGSGVTAFNYYMAYGGTNWGYTGSPSSGFTSYDYGAAITEDRLLRDKFAVQKSIGYQLDTVHQITNMKRVQEPTLSVDGATVRALARQATEHLDAESVTGYGSRYIGLRHENSNNTGTTKVSFGLTLGKAEDVVEASYTNDDRDTDVITYTGSWEKSPATAPWAQGNYKNTETYSDKAGDTLTYTFTGTGIQVIMPEGPNHGIGEIFIDDVKYGETDTFKLQNANKQVVTFVKDDLTMGEHTLKIRVTGRKGNPASQGTFVALDALNVLTPAEPGGTKTTRVNNNDPRVTYTTNPAWTYSTGEDWTRRDYQGDQTWSKTKGAEASFTFTGTGIDIISPKSNNHGFGDVFIDGDKVGEMNTCIASQQYHGDHQKVAFSKRDLTNGTHTLKVVVRGEVGCPDGNVEPGTAVAIDAFDVIAPADDPEEPAPSDSVRFPRIPAKADTFLTIHGRDALGVVADLKLGTHDIYYSTSEIVGFEPLAQGDTLVLNGYAGDPGEIAFRYDAEPTVSVTGPAVEKTYDADTKSLRLNFTNGQASTVTIAPAEGRSLTIKFVDRDSLAKLWKIRGAKGGKNATTVVSGADLVRSVKYDGAVAHLFGSMNAAGTVTAYVPEGITSATWNGSSLGTVSDGVVTGSVPGPADVTLPQLTFKKMAEAFEADPTFDDSDWVVANKTTTRNSRQGPGNQGVILDSNAYGAYEGNVWYRASYTAGSNVTSISLRGNGGTGAPSNPNLNAAGGTAAIMQVWVNGTYVGARPANGNTQTFTVPAGTVTAGQRVVVSTLVMNLGQNLDWSDDGLSRQNRGLHSATLGNSGAVTWKIQGALGMATPVDVERGLYNNGGLYGERAGWHLPGYPSHNWEPATTLRSSAGVTWYRSSVNLDLPANQDTMLALKVNSSRFANLTDRSRVMMFVNGWNIGLYGGNVGPQTQFTIPSGFLNPNGRNDIAVAVSAMTDDMGPESLSLVKVGAQTGGVKLVSNPAPAVPTMTATATSAETTRKVGETATVNGTVTIPDLTAGVELKAEINWGDGTTTNVEAGATFTGTHAYESDGNFTPTVVIKDAHSGSTLATATAQAIAVGDAPVYTPAVTAPAKAKPGETITVTASGYAANVKGEVWLYSDPVNLGSITIDAQGQGSADVAIPADAQPGTHRIEVRQGSLSADKAITIEAPATQTATPSVSASASVEPSESVEPSASASGTATATATASQTVAPSQTATSGPTASESASVPVITASPTGSPGPSLPGTGSTTSLALVLAALALVAGGAALVFRKVARS